MAKLFLKFEDRILKEIPLSLVTVTIGRQPENVLRIENPAVSGNHAKIYCESGHYVLEDSESFNGTYVNNQRISKIVLKHGDKVVVGKHTIEFHDPQSQAISRPSDRSQGSAESGKARAPQLDRTVFLDTAKAKEMLAAAVAASSGSGGVETTAGDGRTDDSTTHTARQTVGTLTILEGRTDEKYYVLSSPLTVIGKSRMAGIRLKRWFAPRVVASIYRAEDIYFLAPARPDVKIKVNGTLMDGSKTRLEAGCIIEVAGVKATFNFSSR